MEKLNVPRPARFSDPFSDFEEEELKAILRKDDADLTGTDFQSVFQASLPAGEYRECLYFAPVFLRLLRVKVERNEGSGIVDALDDFLWWYEHYHAQLENGGCLPVIQESLKEILFFALEQFRPAREEDAFPGNHTIVETLVGKLINRDSFLFLKTALDETYSGKMTFEKSAWLVDICGFSRSVCNDDWRAPSSSLFSARQRRAAVETVLTHIMHEERHLNDSFWIRFFTEIITDPWR